MNRRHLVSLHDRMTRATEVREQLDAVAAIADNAVELAAVLRYVACTVPADKLTDLPPDVWLLVGKITGYSFKAGWPMPDDGRLPAGQPTGEGGAT